MARAIHINLLDWRSARRKRREQQFLAVLGLCAAAAIAICILAMIVVNTQISHQRERNQYLQEQIAKVNQQIRQVKTLKKTRANLLARMQVIQQLQKHRSDIVHFFDAMTKLLPNGIYLNKVTMKGNHVTLQGKSASNGYIVTYMKNLADSPYFTDPRLVVIKTRKSNMRDVGSFTIKVKAFPKKSKAAGKKKGGK